MTQGSPVLFGAVLCVLGTKSRLSLTFALDMYKNKRESLRSYIPFVRYLRKYIPNVCDRSDQKPKKYKSV